jgi:nicotinamide-nucleotide amidase
MVEKIMFTKKTVQELAQVVVEKLTQAGLIAATAESCTGGGVAYAITEISGSSLCFDRGFVTYSNDAKTQMLGIDELLIKEYGAVSEQVVEQMAIAAVQRSEADIAVAISGIAGPNGGTPEKPVGTVCISWYNAHSDGKTATYQFVGDRTEVRTQAIRLALVGIIEMI